MPVCCQLRRDTGRLLLRRVVHTEFLASSHTCSTFPSFRVLLSPMYWVSKSRAHRAGSVCFMLLCLEYVGRGKGRGGGVGGGGGGGGGGRGEGGNPNRAFIFLKRDTVQP